MNFLTMLLICSITVSLAAIIFWVLSPILNKICNAKWLYLSWMMIIIAYIIPIRPIFDLRAYSSIPPVITTQEKLTTLATYSFKIEEIAQKSVDMSALTVYHFILYLWVIGFITALGIYVIKYIRFVRLIRCESESVNNLEADVFEKVSAKFGIVNTVRIKIYPQISSPLLIGFVKPIILLPRSDFSAEELTFIFQHELTHYKNKDLWWKALVLLATSIHWFNPVVYLVARSVNFQSELVCDNIVTHGANKTLRQQYSNTFLAMIGKYNKLQSDLTISLSNSEKETKKRISLILNPRKKRAGGTVLIIIVICLILTGAIFSGCSIPPSMQYYDRKWDTNSQWNKRLFKDESEADTMSEYPFMGSIKISYYFNSGKSPSWLENSGIFQMNVSAYNAIMLQEVNFKDVAESNAFADDQLSLKYIKMREDGFVDKKPQQSEYTYTIELPENISNYNVATFYKEPETSTPQEQDYYVTYKQDGTIFQAHFTPEQLEYYNQTIEQAAKKAVEDFAKKSGIKLSYDFQDNIEIYRN